MSQRAGIAFKDFNGRNHVQEKREQWRVRQAVELATALTLGRARPNQGASHGTQLKVGGLKPKLPLEWGTRQWDPSMCILPTGGTLEKTVTS